jgi:hypothetical protein
MRPDGKGGGTSLWCTSVPANHLPGTSGPRDRFNTINEDPRSERLGAGVTDQLLSPRPHEPDLRIPEQRCEMPEISRTVQR